MALLQFDHFAEWLPSLAKRLTSDSYERRWTFELVGLLQSQGHRAFAEYPCPFYSTTCKRIDIAIAPETDYSTPSHLIELKPILVNWYGRARGASHVPQKAVDRVLADATKLRVCGFQEAKKWLLVILSTTDNAIDPTFAPKVSAVVGSQPLRHEAGVGDELWAIYCWRL